MENSGAYVAGPGGGSVCLSCGKLLSKPADSLAEPVHVSTDSLYCADGSMDDVEQRDRGWY